MIRFNKKVAIVLVAISIITTGSIGCGSKTNNKTSIESTANKPDKPDEKLTKKVKKENIVLDGNVYEDGEYMYGTMLIKDDAKREDIDRVINEYAKKIKSKHKNKKVNVQAVQKGRNVGNVTIK